MLRVHRFDQINAKKPAKLLNSKSLTRCFSRQQIWPVFSVARQPDSRSPNCRMVDHPAVSSARSPLAGCSVLRLDLGSKGLGYYLSVPHDKCVCGEFVPVDCCFCGPENVGVLPLNATQLHGKRRARHCKLRNQRLRKKLDRVPPFQRSARASVCRTGWRSRWVAWPRVES